MHYLSTGNCVSDGAKAIVRATPVCWTLEHISACCSKRLDDREKSVLEVTRQRTRDRPFGDITASQWLTRRPVEARVCIYPTDRLADRARPTDFLCAPITQKRFDHLLGRNRSKFCRKLGAFGCWGCEPPKIAKFRFFEIPAFGVLMNGNII